MSWSAVLLASFGVYALKALGAVVPRRVVEHPRVQAAAPLLPVALLVALVVVNALGAGRALRLDARLAGMGIAVVLILRRAPFLVIVVAAAAATAVVRSIG